MSIIVDGIGQSSEVKSPDSFPTSDYQINSSNLNVYASNSITVTLPPITDDGEYCVVNIDGSRIVVNTGDNSTILGEDSQSLNNKYDSVTFFNNDVEWYVK